MPYPNYGNKYLNSFFPYISKIWNNLPNNIKSLRLEDFKIELKIFLKPVRNRHYNVGPKQSNSYLARIRTGRTNLNQDKFTIGLTDEPIFLCLSRNETPEHYLLDCFLFTTERQTLFNLAEHIIPIFNLSVKRVNLKFLQKE